MKKNRYREYVLSIFHNGKPFTFIYFDNIRQIYSEILMYEGFDYEIKLRTQYEKSRKNIVVEVGILNIMSGTSLKVL